MRRTSEHLRANKLLIADYLFGIRGYGLIIYGALPASLGALGAFKAPDQAALGSRLGFVVLPFVLCVALIPVAVTFALVQQRLGNWYLLPDYLTLRASVVTFGIVLASSLVSGANGLLLGTYKLLSVKDWWAMSFALKARPLGECLLLSCAYLVGSSTLFLTVIKEDSDLPFLPNKDEVTNVKSLRGYLKGIVKNPLQDKEPENGDAGLTAQVTALTAAIDTATTVIVNLGGGFTRLGRKRFYDELSTELNDLRAAAQDVGQAHLNWRSYWASDTDVSALNDEMRERRVRIERLRRLRLDG